MDSVTQACLGGTIGGAVLGRQLGRRALVAGAALATLPDLDSFLDFGDAVADYTYHRSFSHSLLVLTGVATLLAALLSRWRRTRAIGFRHWWWFCALILLTHPLLDAFTTYGTQLLWPIPSPPVAWKTIFIIDPLYTLPMLIALVVGLIRGAPRRASIIGLGLATLYLAFTVGARAEIMARLAPQLAERGLDDQAVMVQPAPLTSLLWRVTVIDDERQLEGMISLFDEADELRLDSFSRSTELAPASLEFAAGRRLAWFAGPFRRYDVVDDRLVVTDTRMGMPGHHFFAFAIARRPDPAAPWQAMPARSADSSSISMAMLQTLLQRILDPDAFCPADLALQGEVQGELLQSQCRPEHMATG
ncbi:inner membrane protein [Kushneria sinocarnis]|uniref:Inner membrane protein n=1 Tax=Kushneria sinocarnis TaxID=595502 RepID=A0A420WTT0_9GAMM|nr:metal-dependent hydrolase [Kushneria sinocarnis]RKQ96859.1 inner membrane protein [Kushneria sinocarnis]